MARDGFAMRPQRGVYLQKIRVLGSQVRAGAFWRDEDFAAFLRPFGKCLHMAGAHRAYENGGFFDEARYHPGISTHGSAEFRGVQKTRPNQLVRGKKR